MTNANLQAWLDRNDVELINTIKLEIRQHLTKLKASGNNFYGYAILPGESYLIQNIFPAFNCESDIKSENSDDDIYYRYCVDEWENWEYDEFPKSNKLIDLRNSQFKELHPKKYPDKASMEDFFLDNFEMAHVDKLLDAILKAMIGLKHERIFNSDKFLIIWFSDLDDEIITKSVKELNSQTVYETFMQEFGDI